MRFVVQISAICQYIKRSSPSSSADAPEERLGSSRCGTSRLRDFHFIEFRPADIPVWLTASCERLLRAPRPLRLRLRCQKTDRCRSKVRHKCRPYHRPGSLAPGGQDCGHCPLRVQDPQSCTRIGAFYAMCALAGKDIAAAPDRLARADAHPLRGE